MGIPAYSDLMLPLLQFAGDGREHHISEAFDPIADYLGLSYEERNEFLPNANQSVFNYRLHWANTYLKKAGLLRSVSRGVFQITERGLDVLKMNPISIDRAFLLRFPEFEDFATNRSRSNKGQVEVAPSYSDSEQTPKELIHSVYQGLREELAEDLVEIILASSPAFFEKLVVDLLLAMGYGGSLENAGKTIGRSGDGGLDGYIQEDKLGLDTIYIQAKRWATDHVVGRPALQAFVGSLLGAGATKGVFITTSRFSKEASDYVRNIQNLKVILLDGQQLTQLMIEHNVGVGVEATYVVKKVDRDYFEAD